MLRPLVKNTTRRRLLWFGIALVLLPTAFVVFTLVQPREYTSSVFVEVGKPGVITYPHEPAHATLYLILLLVGIYLPGFALLIAAFIGYFSRRSASGTQNI
jgi:hypothetical protein